MEQTPDVPATTGSPEPPETIHVQELDDCGEAGADWITRLLGSGLFRHLSAEHSHRFFAELEAVSVRAGEVVVEQGVPAEHFHVVTQGRCAVTRRVAGSERQLQLKVLGEGDAFGAASLISGAPAATSVRMLGDGVLMRLGQTRFRQLMATPMLSVVGHDDARRLIEQGAVWLDVRHSDEGGDDPSGPVVSVPQHVLEIEAADLDRSKTYVVFCESGACSAAGAFLLTRLGFDAHVLDGGLARMRAASGAAARGVHRSPGEGADDPDAVRSDRSAEALPAADEGVDACSHGAHPGGGGHSAASGTPPVSVQESRPADAGPAVSPHVATDQRDAAIARPVETQREEMRILERELDRANARLAATEARLARGDARLSRTLEMLADANEQLAATAVKLVETNDRLSSAEARIRDHERTRSMPAPPEPAADAAAGAGSGPRDPDRELASARQALDRMRRERDEARTARERAETALQAALGELRDHISGLATLRSALTHAGD